MSSLPPCLHHSATITGLPDYYESILSANGVANNSLEISLLMKKACLLQLEILRKMIANLLSILIFEKI